MRPEKRTRPVPPGGLERAEREGARRRRTALASGVGAALLAVASAAVLGTLGGGGAQSLQIADVPTPTPTSTATSAATSASPTPAATAGAGPTASAAQPSNAPSGGTGSPPQGEPGPTATPGPTQGPTAPAATATAAPRERPAYTESPRSGTSTSCTGYTPEGPGTCSLTTGGGEVRSGGTVGVERDMCVLTASAEELVLDYDTGQEQELVATHGGVEVWRFSGTVTYAQGPHQRTIARQQCLSWTLQWDTRDADGRLVPPGDYELSYRLTPSRVNGSAEADPFSTSTFAVRVTA